jgi:hypothetical protein
VVFKNGGQTAALPEGARVFVTARRAGSATQGRRPIEIDARGRFLLEGLPAGEFEVQVFCVWSNRQARATQVVSVPEGGELNIHLTLDLAQPDQKNER